MALVMFTTLVVNYPGPPLAAPVGAPQQLLEADRPVPVRVQAPEVPLQPLRVRACVCVCACVRARVYVCAGACARSRACVFVCARACLCARVRAC